MKLLGADIHRDDIARAMAQRIIRKATRAGADIKHNLVFKIQLQKVRHAGQFQPGTRDVLLIRLELDVSVSRHEVTRLGVDRAINKHFTKLNPALCLRAAGRKAFLDDELVESDFVHISQ